MPSGHHGHLNNIDMVIMAEINQVATAIKIIFDRNWLTKCTATRKAEIETICNDNSLNPKMHRNYYQRMN